MVFQARVDPRPVKPNRYSILDCAVVKVDGALVAKDSEEGPRLAESLREITDYQARLDRQYHDSLAVVSGDRPAGSQDLVQVDAAPDMTTSADYVTSAATGTRVRWTSGFAYRPEVCKGGDIIWPYGSTEGTPSPVENEIDESPFIIEGTDSLSTFGALTESIREERAEYAFRQLVACRASQIEKELWRGDLTQANDATKNRFLADTNVNLVEGDRLLGYITAFAVLEQAISDGTCSQQGMIHARADTVSIWISQHLVRRYGNLLLSEIGTIVLAGSGYDGSAPVAGTPHLDPAHAGKIPSSDSAWAYATTVPDVYLSDLLQPQYMLERVDYANNNLKTFQRQVGAVTWGCTHAGVHVDHTTAISTTGS
jgi:hypothetical protein